MDTAMTLAAAAEPTRGWGGPIALALVFVLWLTGATLHDRYLRTHPSPTPAEEGSVSDTSQASAVSDTDDTDRDTTPDTGWWGWIVETGGRRHRVYDQVVDDQADEAAEPEPEEEAPTIEDVIARLEDRGLPYMEIVRHLMDEFEVSEATAKRRIREVREERRAVA